MTPDTICFSCFLLYFPPLPHHLPVFFFYLCFLFSRVPFFFLSSHLLFPPFQGRMAANPPCKRGRGRVWGGAFRTRCRAPVNSSSEWASTHEEPTSQRVVLEGSMGGWCTWRWESSHFFLFFSFLFLFPFYPFVSSIFLFSSSWRFCPWLHCLLSAHLVPIPLERSRGRHSIHTHRRSGLFCYP